VLLSNGSCKITLKNGIHDHTHEITEFIILHRDWDYKSIFDNLPKFSKVSGRQYLAKYHIRAFLQMINEGRVTDQRFFPRPRPPSTFREQTKQLEKRFNEEENSFNFWVKNPPPQKENKDFLKSMSNFASYVISNKDNLSQSTLATTIQWILKLYKILKGLQVNNRMDEHEGNVDIEVDDFDQQYKQEKPKNLYPRIHIQTDQAHLEDTESEHEDKRQLLDSFMKMPKKEFKEERYREIPGVNIREAAQPLSFQLAKEKPDYKPAISNKRADQIAALLKNTNESIMNQRGSAMANANQIIQNMTKSIQESNCLEDMKSSFK